MLEIYGPKPHSSYTYSLSPDKKTVFETITQTDKKPRRRKRRELMDPTYGAELLEQFLLIRKPEDLVKYSNRHGFPNRDEFRRQIMAPETLAKVKKNQLATVVFSSPVDWFLDLAAAMRWIAFVIGAIEDGRMEQVLSWISATYIPPRDQPGRAPDIPPDAFKLVLKPDLTSPQRADYEAATRMLGQYSSQWCFPSRWKAFPEKEARGIAIANISGHINILVSQVKMVLTTAGTPSFSTWNQTQAMSLVLYNQLSGAQGIKICRNPNCPTKFFLPKSNAKSKRKPRSDRKYCGRPGCQRYCYDHPEKGLGPIRKKGVR